jgi:hypothetical protein
LLSEPAACCHGQQQKSLAAPQDALFLSVPSDTWRIPGIPAWPYKRMLDPQEGRACVGVHAP